MKEIEIIVPVKNEEKNIAELTRLLNQAFTSYNINYNIIFVLDKSVDNSKEEILRMAKEFPVILHEKVGKGGKGYSLMEGFALCTAPYVGFIDADLQYPAFALPKMLEKLKREEVGVVVANRKVYKSQSILRKVGSRLNAFFFGKLLLGLNCDIQSGLKVFRRDLFAHINADLVTPWTFDIPLLHAAQELGYKIEQVDIEFENRANGASHVGFLKTAWAIAKCAIKTRFTPRKIYNLETGIVYKRKRYVTHTGLPHHKSAIYVLVGHQKFTLILLGFFLLVGFVLQPLLTAQIFIGVLSSIYFFDVLFNLYVILKSLHLPPEVAVEKAELKALVPAELPVYTIMCPLYKEWQVLEQFVEGMGKLDWPHDKLEVLLLLEENDSKTVDFARSLTLPDYVKIVVVPHSMPKTKPKACNYGLQVATGEYVVIYDAEDQPAPDQLKKAYIAFTKSPEKVFCIQAKLNYYNTKHNLLTRLFTAEYSLWFDVILPGLQSIGTTIPLGGTSNHFRTTALKGLHGWDPFNVTEDCDLGVRLFKDGYETAIIDSVTLEEATSGLGNWIRQRSRWIKGYMQTYFVHMREPIKFFRTKGWHAALFQLIIGMRIYFMLINPILWLATLSYFVLYKYVGVQIEALYPSWVFYMAAISLVFGNFTYIYNYMIGCAKREHWSVIKYVFLVPFYWMFMSLAAMMAFWQLIFKPHHWEKTTHGAHLRKAAVVVETDLFFSDVVIKIKSLANKHRIWSIVFSSAGFLVVAGVLTNFLNYFYNAILSRKISLEDFGLLSLISSLFFISSIPLSALSRTITNRSALYYGKHNKPHYWLWKTYRKWAMWVGLGLGVIWLSLIPLMANFFNVDSYAPFLIFTPVWLIGLVSAIDSGYLSGNQKFYVAGILILSEAIAKLLITYIALVYNNPSILYYAVPFSLFVPFILGWYFASTGFKPNNELIETPKFPYRFYVTSMLIKFSMVAFLSFDVMLAKHFLDAADAGSYALISLVGKMIFFVSGLFSQFITPILSKEAGKKVKDSKTFIKIFLVSTLMGFVAYGFFGLLGGWTAPILLGPKMYAISHLLPIFGLSMVFFSISSNLVSYYQIKEDHSFPILNFVLSILQVIGIFVFHSSVLQIIHVMVVSSALTLISVGSLIFVRINRSWIVDTIHNILGLFKKFTRNSKSSEGVTRVLIFNWRDTKHRFAGGAEVYIHELAKRLVSSGYDVTLFCGNDRNNSTYEEIDGIKVHRRGGFYTVYIWAFIYYIFKFKGNYDVVVDVENGIPFFTPFYVRAPKVLVVFHIHQEIFLNHLKFYQFGIGHLAMILEKYLMPIVYREVPIMTISESSKFDILKIFSNKVKGLRIICPGISPDDFCFEEKSVTPIISYVGRLKPHKNVDVLIKSFARVLVHFPEAVLQIAGDGESLPHLTRLVNKLGISTHVIFLGRVSEVEKRIVYAKSWFSVQPSSIEGWGITVIESNACGTPVIASNVPGLKNSVLHEVTGLLVPKENVTLLEDAMLGLLRDSDLRNKLSKRCLLWAQNFNWDISSADFSVLLRETIVHKESLKSDKSILNLFPFLRSTDESL